MPITTQKQVFLTDSLLFIWYCKCGFYDYSLGQLFSCKTKYAFILTSFLFSQEWSGNLRWFKWPDGCFSVCHWLNRCVNIFIFIEGWSWEKNLLKPLSVVGFWSKSHSSQFRFLDVKCLRCETISHRNMMPVMEFH